MNKRIKKKQFDRIAKSFPYFVNEIRECVKFNHFNTDKTKYQVMRFDKDSFAMGSFVYDYLRKQCSKGAL